MTLWNLVIVHKLDTIFLQRIIDSENVQNALQYFEVWDFLNIKCCMHNVHLDSAVGDIASLAVLGGLRGSRG